MTRKNLVRSALAVLTSSVVLAACGTAHNTADVTFAQGMVPHHRQAVAMAELVEGRGAGPAVVDLAERIKRAQAPEITTLTERLNAWGEPTEHPAGHGGSEMADLGTATGPDFDRRWLSMMITHHEGAVRMAETELADGADPDTRELAGRIVAAQKAEIDEMRALLPRS
ncbi:DUF305 domain-containing protein [Actinokineospora auranticolor]|uniref:Uncharacterized protein (DUF305 family) n=1 Tax=Actinokineospora auranticolor TaxID=155976 RepID=A0A2S6GMC0_9PSEU|nr:DUF305 domain-containing protein [Actinokineospora auranticolor]PPK66384.1 uncharacterized protein (DUF305 family) [Actinokineospora auranticolor]